VNDTSADAPSDPTVPLRAVWEALMGLRPWERVLCLAYFVDRELGPTIAEPIWQQVSVLRREEPHRT
jgi:hypothetical protein